MKRITEYGDCDVFKPGEVWRGPRGALYYVDACRPGTQAKLRRIPRVELAGIEQGPIRYAPWDGVAGWVREAARDE